MPVIVVAGIVAVVLYVLGCVYALQHLFVPSWPYAVAAGGVTGLLVTVVVLVATLLRVGGLAPVTVTHRDVAQRLPRKRRAVTAHGRDDAWPHYLFAQSRTDLRAVLRHTVAGVATAWWAAIVLVGEATPVLFFWPILLIPLVWGVATTVSVVVSTVAVAALTGVALLLAWVGWLAVVVVLRGLDHGLRTLRRTKATCPRSGCNERSRVPAFRCRCGQVHHDIRPGRQGAVMRRCGCGALLPTTVLRASAAGLVPVCQRCEQVLHTGSAAVTDVVTPVFGPTSAGKTRLVYAGMVALHRHLAAVGGALRPEGGDNEATFAAARRIVEDGGPTMKTAVGAPPAITVRMRTERGPALLHLFDAAGESFVDRTQAVELTFLADTQGLIFVLDPFSIPEVVSELGADCAALEAAHPAVQEPEQAYLVTAQWLTDQGVPVHRLPLAIAVVKADLLLALPPGAGLDPDAGSDRIARWLREKSLDNLVDAAERDFGRVRFFLVSSLDDITSPDGLAVRTSPARPLLWLLERSGVTVPEQRQPVSP